MNLNFLKDLSNQLLLVWHGIKTYQKFTVVLVGIFLVGLVIFLMVGAASTRYVPLYSPERLVVADAADIKTFLDGARIPYKLKTDTLILVPETQVHRIRMDLASAGIPKIHTGKGFELFDTNTWIKGEKELQVLEMRALMGQLEQDICQYENIKTCRVILDIAPPRPFGGSLYKTKASVILSLMPGARLNTSQLRAVTYHVAGAVRGLTPNMVAISDTTGRLYQALDPDGEIDLIRNDEIALEERLKAKVDGMLVMVVGADNFYSTVQVTMNRNRSSEERTIYSGTVNGVKLGDAVEMSITQSGLQVAEKQSAELGTPGTNTEAIAGAVKGGEEILNRNETRDQSYKTLAVPKDVLKVNRLPGKIDSVSIGVLIDKTIAVDASSDLPPSSIVNGMRNTEDIKKEIMSQLEKITEGYGVQAAPAVDFVEFDKTKITEVKRQETLGNMLTVAAQTGTVLLVILIVLGMFWTFNRFWKRHMQQPPSIEEEEGESPAEEPSLIEVEAMIEAIKMRLQIDPDTVIEALRDWLSEEQEISFK